MPAKVSEPTIVWNASEISGLERKERTLAKSGEGSDGARGRSRTDTLLRAADFHPTSTFVAPAELGRVRGLEHAFTVALRP